MAFPLFARFAVRRACRGRGNERRPGTGARAWLSIRKLVLSRVCIFLAAAEVVGRKIRLVLGVFRNVDAFDLEHDRTGAVVAAGDHDALVVSPVLHDGAACKRRIDVAADGVPCLRAGEGRVELSPEVVEVVLSGLALEQVFLSDFKAGAGTAFGVCEIVLLELGEQLLIDDRHFALVLQGGPLSRGALQ